MTASQIAFCEHALDVFDRLTPECRRPIEYIVEQIMSEKREDADVTLLFNTGREILRKNHVPFQIGA